MSILPRLVNVCGIAMVLVAVTPCGRPQAAQAVFAAEAAEIYTTIDNERLLEIVKDEGYAAQVDANGVVVWKLEGIKTQLFVSETDGSNMQFHVSFRDGNATLKKVNAWNRTKRYSRTYLDDDGDPHLELDLDLEGGVTRDRIVDFLATCKASMTAWCEEVVE